MKGVDDPSAERTERQVHGEGAGEWHGPERRRRAADPYRALSDSNPQPIWIFDAETLE